MKRMIFVISTAARAIWATEWNVYAYAVSGMTGEEQLTNAFANAQAGDTITIHEGTYNLSNEQQMERYYLSAGASINQIPDTTAGVCFKSAADNLTVQGAPGCTRDQVVLSGLGANSPSQNGLHRIMFLSGRNCLVRDLTFFKGMGNFTIYYNGTSQGWNYRRGGGLALSNADSVVSNCVFTSCYAGHGGALAGGKVYGCEFRGNQAVGSNEGGSLYGVSGLYDSQVYASNRGIGRNLSGVISNCVFGANEHVNGVGLLIYSTAAVIDCTFTDNLNLCIRPSGTDMPSEITRCTFKDNVYGATTACVTNYPGKISDCTFVGGNLLADCTDVEDCEFAGNGTTLAVTSAVSRCSLTRCEFRDFNIRYGALLLDVQAMTNCLIRQNVMWGNSRSGVFWYTGDRDASIVNCTVVTNQSNATYWNSGSGTVTFKNTLFFMNKTGGQGWGSFDFWATADEGTSLDSARFVNNLIKINGSVAGENNLNWFGESTTPGFMRDKAPWESLPAYSLHFRSPCVDAGVTEVWMADAVDMAGRARLRNLADIGCYECWLNPRGTAVYLR
jgi:hypothetical protein